MVDKHEPRSNVIQPEPSNLPRRTLRATWKSLAFSAIVIRHPFGKVVIVPATLGDSDVVEFRRCDLVRFKTWHTVSTAEVVAEVEHAWADSDLTVDIFTDELSHSDDAPFNPFDL